MPPWQYWVCLAPMFVLGFGGLILLLLPVGAGVVMSSDRSHESRNRRGFKSAATDSSGRKDPRTVAGAPATDSVRSAAGTVPAGIPPVLAAKLAHLHDAQEMRP